jgi:16S rRNA (adenine1518-N6/adenine1519-N6)-dimethyltransferase
MTYPALDIPNILRKAGVKPDKSLGQNFLIDEIYLDQIIQAAKIQQKDTILEIGPGLGSLTRRLAQAAFRVIAVELDARLIPLLQDVLRSYTNVSVLHGDILKVNLTQLQLDPGYLVVANIPYYITSAVIRHLLELPSPPRRFVLTIQEEVADRICAAPGDMSMLALSVQVYGQPTIVTHIPAEAFYPSPEINSAVVSVDLYPTPQIPVVVLDVFFRLTKAGFSQKRKTLRNALAGGLGMYPSQVEHILRKASIDPMRRAESLSISEWEQVVNSFLN